MAGRKTENVTQREVHLAEVAKLSRRGYNGFQISQKLGLSQQQISYDLKIVRERLIASYAELTDPKHLVAEMITSYQEMLTELYEAWERSKEDGEKVVVESGLGPNGDDEEPTQSARKPPKLKLRKVSMVELKRIVTTEGRLPASQYMSLIRQVRQDLRELVGLDAAKKLDPESDIPWEEMEKEAKDEVRDSVEDRITEGLDG